MNITPKKLYLPYLNYRDFYQIHRVVLVQILTCFPCPIPMSKFHLPYNKKVLRIQFYLSCSFGENFNGSLFHMSLANQMYEILKLYHLLHFTLHYYAAPLITWIGYAIRHVHDFKNSASYTYEKKQRLSLAFTVSSL